MKKGGGSESTIVIGPSGLGAPQLRKRPTACPISGVRAKIILYYIINGRIETILLEFLMYLLKAY